jgi:hypothetical protein
VGALVWLRGRLADAQLAAIGSALFLLSPYLAITQTMQRTAFAETVAAVFLPYVFLFIDGARPVLSRVLLGAVVFAGLACTHVITATLGGVAAVAYSALSYGWRRMLETMLAGLLGAAMAAFSLAPALLLQAWVASAWWWPYWMMPAYHALFSPRASFDILKGTALVMHAAWGLCVLACVLLLWHWRRLARPDRGLAVTLAGVLLATTWISVPLWQIVPFMWKTQFPHRFLGIGALLAAATFALLAQKQARLRQWLLLLVLALSFGGVSVAFSQSILPASVWRRHGWLLPHFARSSAERLADEENQRLDSPEYAPRLANDIGWPPGHATRPPGPNEQPKAFEQILALSMRDSRAALPRFGTPQLVQGQVSTLHVQKQHGRWEFAGQIEAGGATVRLPLLYWPSLKAKGARLGPDPTTGLTLLYLAAGPVAGRVVLSLSSAEILGIGASAIGWGVWLLGLGAVAVRRGAGYSATA